MSVPLTSNVSSVHEVLEIPADSVTVTSLHSDIAHFPPVTNLAPTSEVTVPTAPVQPHQSSQSPPSTTPATATSSAPPVVSTIPDATPAPTTEQQPPAPQTEAQPAQPRRTSNQNRKPVQKLNLTATVFTIS